MTPYNIPRILRRPVRGAAVALLVGGALAACSVDELLDVPDPDVATPESLQDASALPAVRAGAIGDFAISVTASNTTEDGLAPYTGLFTDELSWAETFPTREQIDRRNIEVINGTMEGLFSLVQRGRYSLERAADGYTRLDPNNAARAEMYALASLSYSLIGEAYCNGVPIGRLDASGAPIYGDPQTNTQLFDRAIVLADSALAAPGATAALKNLANVAKARALVNQNKQVEAAALLAAVPTNFVYNLEYSDNSNRQNNGIYADIWLNRRFSPQPTGPEGTNGLPFRLDNDPRVVAPRGTGASATGFDGSTPLYLPAKFNARTSPFPLATGIEARLIEAEAKLKGGDAAGALAILNTLRTAPGTAGSGGVAGLTPLTLQTTPAAQQDQLFKERAYWLFLTSHRLGDLRRLVRQYGRNAESVFPTGNFFKGATYGTDVNFPVPFSEKNNPKFQQCIDRAA